MKTVYIVALTFNEEFHDCVTDAENIKGVFSSKDKAEKFIAENLVKEVAADAFRKEWDALSRKVSSKKYLSEQEKCLKKHGFADWQDYYKYDGKVPHIFNTTLDENLH